MNEIKNIKAIIGLGNPGPKFYDTRHNIGFRVLDALCEQHNQSWQSSQKLDYAQIKIGGNDVLLVKPLTFMNSSGEVISWLKKKGINSENILVVHDELELPFGSIKLKFDGSAKGHNGLKSIISFAGSNFYRLRVGISRPEDRNSVPDYVLSKFNNEEQKELDTVIQKAVIDISNIF